MTQSGTFIKDKVLIDLDSIKKIKIVIIFNLFSLDAQMESFEIQIFYEFSSKMVKISVFEVF